MFLLCIALNHTLAACDGDKLSLTPERANASWPQLKIETPAEDLDSDFKPGQGFSLIAFDTSNASNRQFMRIAGSSSC